MRDELAVLVIAKTVERKLGAHVRVLQGEKYTEWRAGNKGFAVGPHVRVYNGPALAAAIVQYMTPKKPTKPT